MPRFMSPGELANELASANLLCYGDSWMMHPFANLTPELENIHRGENILILGDSGLEAAELVNRDLRHLPMFEQSLTDNQGTLRRVYLSAGGNDFAGFDDFASILVPDASAAAFPPACFDIPALTRLFTQIFADIDTLCKLVAARAPNAEVRLHNYDYAIPNGKTKIGGGKWLKVPMDACHVPDDGNLQRPGFRREVVATLIDTFGHWQENTARNNPNAKFIRTAGTIADDCWMDELHPSGRGFKALARKFAAS